MSESAYDLQGTLGEYMAARSPAWTDPAVLNLTNISAGWECDVYAFDLEHGLPTERRRAALVLRVYPGGDAYQKSGREYGGMRLLRRAAYPVPEVFLLERDASPIGAPFIIMERITGQLLWPLLFRGPEADRPGLLTLFCGLLVQLHTLDWRPFAEGPSGTDLSDPQQLIWREEAHWQTVFDQYPAPGFQPTLSWLMERRADVRAAWPGPVHWDFHPNNVLIQPDGSPSVIDWTQIDISDTRFDLAWTLLLIGSAESEAWRARVLAEYERLLGKTVENLEFFEVAAGLKRLYSFYISVTMGAEKLGMRPGAEKIMLQQAPALLAVYRMIFAHTHLSIPELDTLQLSGDRHEL